jgi:hypothetical protein
VKQLLYLHGFNSSPQSHKARVTAQWFARNHPDVVFQCPTLSLYPEEAGATLERVVDDIGSPSLLVLGSSMGGFYATWVAARCRCPAVLINPAVRPWQGREYLLGEQTNYHTGETHWFEQRDIDAFARFDVNPLPQPGRFLVLLQTGDEVLDYRLAADKYRDCELVVEEGGDHAFQGYERHLPKIHQFWMQQIS